ncbi:MAG: menaquinone biosynthesis protein [Pyrinomonadaceae bacterium]|nr:menaquinone biosynthesis protein [Pyrinomonadaceae bacterium]
MNVSPRISASSYSNTAPLVWSFLYGQNRGKYELIMDNAPARSAELLAQNRIDAALVPVIAYQLIENIRLIPHVCVGAREKVRSVCLVTKGEDLEQVRTVALDVSSKTSVALTKIIFREFLGFEPKFENAAPNAEEMLKTADCALLIGDPALMISDSGFRISDLNENSNVQRPASNVQFRKFDLVELWRQFTNFGFVFAMWMANEEKLATAGKIDFAAARDEGIAHVDEIISNYESQITLTREDFKKYLTENISYSISDSMQKGLELYFKLACKHSLCETEKQLKFI